jgi:hypothetical protein
MRPERRRGRVGIDLRRARVIFNFDRGLGIPILSCIHAVQQVIRIISYLTQW